MKRILLTLVTMMVAFSTFLHAEVPTKDSVTKLYVATFNRAPDAAGLNYWLNDSGLQLEGIASSFFDQPETQEKYPSGSTNTEFVVAVYANLFNRAPEQAGLEYWVAELDSGRVEKSVFILAVINGAQDTVEYGNDATILANKTIVGLAFADAGLDNVAWAVEVMAIVDDSSQSVDLALQMIEHWQSLTGPLPGDVIYSDNSGSKALGDLGAPPLYISSEEPTANTQVSITAEGISGNTINITVEGAGCGTVQDRSGTSPLTIEGTVSAYGDCNIQASYNVNGEVAILAGRFIVAATDPILPPAHVDGGVWVVGDMPAPSTELDSEAKQAVGLPIISTVEGPLEFINGGTSEFTVTSSSGSDIAAILVKVDSYDGYFHVPVYTSGNSATFKLSFDSDFFDEIVQEAMLKVISASDIGSVADLNVYITIIDDLNQVSEPHVLPLQANETGTGDVKVSISWDTASDVDLHVTDPNGVTTAYWDQEPGNGSTLDLDSNAACDIDGVNNENIYWSTGTAVPGQYTVTVDMFDDCEEGGASGTLTMVYTGDDSPRIVSWNLGSTGFNTYTFVHGGAKSKVSGKVTYEDFPGSRTGWGSGRMLPVRFAEVDVVRVEDDVVLATGSTDASGKYELSFTNEDLDHPEYQVKVYARQDSATLKQAVKTHFGLVYAWRLSTIVNAIETPDKKDMNIAITFYDNAGVMNIFDVGVSCNDYARLHGKKDTEELEFIWQEGGTSGSYYSKENKRIVILGSAFDPDEYDDTIIAHEYGHFVLDTYSKDDSKGGYHKQTKRDLPTRAWSEGWATYFASAALNKSFYLDLGSTHLMAHYSIETLPDTVPLGNTGDVLDGNVSEAVVSAMLWDLHDTANESSANALDGFDDLSNQQTAIWTNLTTYLNGVNFEDRGVVGVDAVDFIDGWYCLGYGDVENDIGGFVGNYWLLHELSYGAGTVESCR